MGRGPNVTKEEYDFIKLLIMKSQSTEEICKRVKRSPDTVRCVGYSTDYDDFRTTPTKELRKRRKKDENYQISVDDVCPQEDVAGQCDEKAEKVPDRDDGKDNIMHQMLVSHTAVVMSRIQLQCDSWHVENGKVTMVMDYELWHDICMKHGVSEEVTEKWASRL